jgi:hypothetical protein
MRASPPQQQAQRLALPRRDHHLVDRGVVDRLLHDLGFGIVQQQHTYRLGSTGTQIPQQFHARAINERLFGHHHIGAFVLIIHRRSRFAQAAEDAHPVLGAELPEQNLVFDQARTDQCDLPRPGWRCRLGRAQRGHAGADLGCVHVDDQAKCPPIAIELQAMTMVKLRCRAVSRLAVSRKVTLSAPVRNAMPAIEPMPKTAT